MNSCSDLGSKRQLVISPLALRCVKSKGEFDESRNHAAVKKVAKHRVRYMGQKHRVKNGKV